VTPSNTPSNRLDNLRTPLRTAIRTGIRSCSNTPSNTLRTYSPHPPGSSKGLTRAFYPPANPAALALRSGSQAHDGPDNQTTVDKQHDRSPARQIREWGRWNSPHRAVMRVDSLNPQIINAATTVWLARHDQRLVSMPDRQRESARAFSCLAAIEGQRAAERIHGLPMGFADGLIFPCASQQSRTPDCPPHNPLRHNKTHRRHHLSDDHKDLYARAISKPLALLDRVRRARSPGDQTVAKPKPQTQWKPNSLLGRGKKTRGSGGVPPNSGEPAIIDVILQHIAALFENLGGPSLKNLGRPEKPSTLTQGSHRIRQIELAATRERAGAKTHQRRPWSHGGACRHD